nr:MAG TPA_asm: Putative tail fiber protein fold, Tail fiber, receptor [Bacteriophage sp.]
MSVSFPVTFSQSCYIVNCNGSNWSSSGGATSAGISIRNITLESFVISTWEQPPYRWLALGK